MLWKFTTSIVAAIPLFAVLSAAAPQPAECETCHGSMEVCCGSCNGDFRKAAYSKVCEKKGGIGCNGAGIRDCFNCNGKAQKKCMKCGGSGKGPAYGDSPAPVCARTIDCAKCSPVKVCGKCKKYEPLCKCTLDDPYLRLPRELVYGQIVCPRCDGNGVRQVKGKCEECRRGKVACPDCNAGNTSSRPSK
jgi:hypothetical protein